MSTKRRERPDESTCDLEITNLLNVAQDICNIFEESLNANRCPFIDLKFHMKDNVVILRPDDSTFSITNDFTALDIDFVGTIRRIFVERAPLPDDLAKALAKNQIELRHVSKMYVDETLELNVRHISDKNATNDFLYLQCKYTIHREGVRVKFGDRLMFSVIK